MASKPHDDVHGRGGHAVNVKQVTPEDVLGPLNDVERKNAPLQLFLAGNEDLLRNHPKVSVIGTRNPTTDGIRSAKTVCASLSELGIVIVSGLAEGIDTVAHETAIRSRGKTIAVLGTPLDKSFPAANRQLQDEIKRNHLLVSQFKPGAPSLPSNFPQRNRTMALISNATVIIEAGATSGTMHQGWEALRLGRPLFILEPVLKSPAEVWASKMMEYGAQVLTPANLESLLEVLPVGQLGADAPF